MVDIIIPTINSPPVLEKALKSIQETTSDLSKVHIYIIDDCSKYDYQETLNKYKDLDIHYQRLETSSGPGPARNAGIKAGKSEWICFLDADDLYIDDILKYCDSQYDYFVSQIDDPSHIFHYKAKDEVYGVFHGIGVKRSYIKKYNIYFPEVKAGSEDTCFRAAVIMLSSNGKFYENSYYRYLSNNENHFMTNKIKNVKKLFNDLEYYESAIFFSVFANYLDNLKISNEILNTSYWNNQLFSFLSYFYTQNFGFNEYLIISYLIKKYLNFSLLTQPKQPCDLFFLILLIFSKNFISIKDNLLIFEGKKEEYYRFYYTYENFFPIEFKTLFGYNINMYFDIKNLLILYQNFYYKDYFKI